MKKEVFLIAISASIALGANNQKDLDLINASAAYNQDITGSGVKVGVIDGAARTDVSLLKDKVKEQRFSKYRGSTYNPDYTVDTHGTHVTSIIVGKKLQKDAPHGVAYGATSYNLQVTGRNISGSNSAFEVPSSDEIYSYFINNGVSVINNSWNAPLYPLVGMNGMSYHESYLSAGANFWMALAFDRSNEIKSLAKIVEENKALVVFAAGNEGMSSPGFFATLPSYNEKLRSFLVVGAVDSNKITKNGDELELKGVSVPLFSNGFKGSINYALMAPGNNVVAANAAYNVRDEVLGTMDRREFRSSSGTSQATPYVSGAAALVKEKFPFLAPSQVADVLLSTANQNFTKPKVILKKTTGRGLNASRKVVDKTYYTVFYLDDNEIPMKDGKVDTAQVTKDLVAEGYDYWREAWDAVQASNTNQFKDKEYNWIQKASWQEVFGQGILDIKKALNGIGRLDANRMGDDYIDPKNDKQALYPLEIDKSHGAVIFSNDINQRLWEEKTHIKDAQNRPQKIPSVTQIGIKKTGNGSLTLSGQNTYKGDTIVSEGSLKLTGSITSSVDIADKAKFILGNSAKTARITGNVLNNGVFAGIGVIDGNFDNQGLVMAGFYDYDSPITNGATLEVTKTYKQSSNTKLQIAFSRGDSGSANTQFKAGEFEIASGAKLEFVPIHTAKKLITTGIINIKNDSSMKAIINNFDSNVVDMTNTNLLDFYLNNDKTEIAVVNKGAENPFKITPPTNPILPTNPDSAQGSGSGGQSQGSGTDADGSSSGGSSSQGTGGSSSGENQGGSGNQDSQPSNPSTPTQPSVPSQPSTPTNQDQGNQTPSQPQQPSQPEQQPSQPQTPSGNTDNTGSQGTGGSSSGENQGSSGNQDSQPSNPNTPTQPSQPTQPEEQPNQPQNPSGNTGDNNQNNNTGAGNQNNQPEQQPSQPQTPNANTGNTGTGNQNQNQNNQAEQIAAQQTAGQQAVATLAAVAPSSPDAPIKALQGLLESAATLSPQSTAALAGLDNLPSAQFSDALNAMKNTPTNTNIDSIDTMQKDLTIKNALFLMDPASSLGSLNTSSSVFAPTAAFGDEYLGKVDDVFIKTELSAGIAYRRTDHDDYKQNSYLLDLQAKKALSDSTLLGGFIGLSNSKTEDDLSDTRSNMFSLGLSLNHNFDSFGVLLGASAGMSFNRYEQSIKYLSNAKSDANYKNYFANFQGGVYKSFKLSENLNLTPIALLDYSVIRQDSFSQSGALAKNYEAKTTHFSRGWLGANLVYNTELNNNWRFNASLFAFYWRKFNHKDINQNLSFVEASDQKFLANTSRSEKQGFYGGIAFGASKGNKFFRISLSDEKARAYNQYEIMLRAGLSF
ncbi:S8 family serine peptidase [Campylobacter sp.]|uniref:S8 family serine peptidase n=1 Tax=Campylobacter sp. TaxID=205 RepID=UPI002A801F7C|nr:S8 family serine peptidase [Campylobacter sp.]MDY4802586.1 S8 family serine peptidase [Campylobacter sp.]